MAGNKTSMNISLRLMAGQFTKGIKNIRRQIQTFGRYVKSAFALGSVTAFGRSVVKVGSDFEDAMAKVRSVTNASAMELKTMKNEAERLGATTRYTATEAANALENLTRNGMSAADATRSLSGVLQLAQANSIGLAEAADMVTNTMNMFGLSVNDVSRINDTLSSTAANSATDVTLLYEALVNAAPVANTLGFSLEETSAAIGALAQKGVKGADAGTQLRMALVKLSDPMITKRLRDHGVAIDEETMKSDGLLGTINKLREANLSLTDLTDIFSQKGAAGMSQLISAYGDFERLVGVTGNSAGTTERMFSQSVGTMRENIDTLNSAWEAFLIKMQNKTGGVINGAINFITGLIRNFNSLGGTLMNLANAVIPLVAGKAVTMFRSIQTAAKTAKTKIEAVKTAFAGMGATVASVVTGVVLTLINKWTQKQRELNTAVRDAEKGMADSAKEMAKMRAAADPLIDKLDKDLWGTVDKLTKLFPDFADEIKKAADEAAKTGGYDDLKKKLKEIVDLQSKVTANNSLREIASARQDRLQNTIRKGLNQPGNGGENAGWMYRSGGSDLFNAIKKAASPDGSFDKEQFRLLKDQVSAVIAQHLTENGSDDAITLNKTLHSMGVDTNLLQLNSLIHELMNRDSDAKAAHEAVKAINANTKAVDDARNAMNGTDNNPDKPDVPPKNPTNPDGGGDGGNGSPKDTPDKIRERLTGKIAAANDDLAQGFITNEECVRKLSQAYMDAYQDLRSLTGKTGADNEYTEKAKLYNDRVNDKPIKKIKADNLTGKAEPSVKAVPVKPVVSGDTGYRPEPVKIPVTFEDVSNGVSNFTGQLSSVYNAVDSIGQAFERMGDDSATAWEKIGAGIQILSAISEVMTVINTVTELIKANREQAAAADVLAAQAEAAASVEQAATKTALAAVDTATTDVMVENANKRAAAGVGGAKSETQAVNAAAQMALTNAAADTAATEVITANAKKKSAANIAGAATGAASSMSSIPWVGPVLAAAAFASMLGLMKLLPKFSTGGVFGGNAHGDMNLARVNGGEMILNRNQQARLFNILDGKAGTGTGRNEIVFKIDGTTLKGVMRNIDGKQKPIGNE